MRKGIALLELIFAIVVIAIALVSVPNLIRTTVKASNQVVTQESVSNVASHLDMIMSQFWDDNSTDPRYNNPVLVTNSPYLKEYSYSVGPMKFFLGRRVGSPLSSPRRFALVDINGTKVKLSATMNLGKDGNESEPDDVDDFNNQEIGLQYREAASVENGDYKDIKVDMKTVVNYVSDAPTVSSGMPTYNVDVLNFDNPFDNIESNSTNIKTITVTLTSQNNPDEKIVLRAFSCNIGSSQLKERTF